MSADFHQAYGGLLLQASFSILLSTTKANHRSRSRRRQPEAGGSGSLGSLMIQYSSSGLGQVVFDGEFTIDHRQARRPVGEQLYFPVHLNSARNEMLLTGTLIPPLGGEARGSPFEQSKMEQREACQTGVCMVRVSACGFSYGEY